MAEQIGDLSLHYPYLLLAYWPSAWQRYRGRVPEVGALPGLLLASEAHILGKEAAGVPGTKFWHSTLRSDLNLSFWTAEAEGWIRRISLTFEPQDETPRMRRYYSEQLARKLYVLLADLAWLFKDYSEESIRQKLAENPDSPDLKWWTVTITGQRALVEKAQEIEAAKQEQEQEKQSRGIGFHRGP